MTTKTVAVVEDPRVRAVVTSEVALYYAEGADAGEDRPAHARAGSGLARSGDRLVLVQDDALFVALIDALGAGPTHALALPRGDGVRLFESRRGNKARKPDLECLAPLAPGALVAFGSGSTPARRRALRLGCGSWPPRAELVVCEAMYVALGARLDFAGSELNVEGAAVVGDRLRLFQRGNGAARGELLPVSATVDLPLDALAAYLEACAADPSAPFEVPLLDVRRYEIGRVGGVPLGFTDACSLGAGDRALAWVAAAEASPDTYDDGATVGVCVGWMRDDGSAGRGPVLTAEGEPYRAKVEGLYVDPADPVRAWAVVDADDVDAPARLLTLELDGLSG